MGNTVLGEARKGPAGADPHQVFATAPPASLTPTIRCEGLRIRTKHFARLATVAETAKIGAVYARDSAGVGVGGAGTESSLRLPYEASPFVPSEAWGRVYVKEKIGEFKRVEGRETRGKTELRLEASWRAH